MTFRYLDICSGISAPTMAWRHLGWQAAAYSEIEKFPRAVLAERYGAVPVSFDHRHVAGSNVTPLFGDFTQIEAHHVGPVDLLVGGTPCQDFSVAGLRAGLDGDRGNLSLEYLRLADRTRPRWLVWENVPGVLSIDGGRAFGAILGGMGELGYGFAYRIFDAQYAGVPQRRRRVFVVGYLGDWRRAAAVLFERHSLSRNTPPRRETGAGVAALTANGVGTCGADDNQAQAGHLIAHSLRAEGFDASEDGTGRGTPLVPICIHSDAIGRTGSAATPSPDAEGRIRLRDAGMGISEGAAFNLTTGQPHAIAFGGKMSTPMVSEGLSNTLQAKNPMAVAYGWAVRRLTPRECERLQGFPDDHTAVTYRGKPAADGPRYKALGNSMAVPDVRFIGERIAMVDALTLAEAA